MRACSSLGLLLGVLLIGCVDLGSCRHSEAEEEGGFGFEVQTHLRSLLQSTR